MAQAQPTVLVTGGTGYIGSHTVLALLEANFRVVVVDDLPVERRSRLDPRAIFIEGSSANGSLIRMMLEFHRVVAVVHCAGLHSFDGSQGGPAEPYRRNVASFLTLLECVVALGVGKVVLVSSTAVYGREGGATPDESVEPRPSSALGRSQWMGEQILADFAKVHGMSACVIRAGLVAGADPLGRTGPVKTSGFNLVFQALEVAFGKRAETLVRICPGATHDGTVVSGFVHVSDLAEALVAATASVLEGTPHLATYNCGYDTGCSDRMVVEAVGRITAMHIRHRTVPAGIDVPAEQNADAQAIQRSLGWVPRRTGIDELVRDTLWGGMRSDQGEASDTKVDRQLANPRHAELTSGFCEPANAHGISQRG